MIRHAIRYITAPLLGRLGAAVLHVARAESDRADAAERNLCIEQGRLTECRRYLHEAASFAKSIESASSSDAQTIFDMSKEIATLRSELDSAAADDDHRARTAEALAEAVHERDNLLAASATHAAEVNALRARVRELEGQVDRGADRAPRL